MIVYALSDHNFYFADNVCVNIDLSAGTNLVGFACPPVDYSAFDLLNAFGSLNVSSVQRYNSETGAFETASFDQSGKTAGIDFPIVPGEGYFVFMKQGVSGFVP